MTLSTTAKYVGARCGAKRRQGGKCLQPAGWWTDHVGFGPCRRHAGMAPGVRKHYAEVMAMEELKAKMAKLGIRFETTSFEELEDKLFVAAGLERSLRELISEREFPEADDERAPDAGTRWLFDKWEAAIERSADISEVIISKGFEERRLRLPDAQQRQLLEAHEEMFRAIPAAYRPAAKRALAEALGQRGGLGSGSASANGQNGDASKPAIAAGSSDAAL